MTATDPLTVGIEDGDHLVIRIGIDVLANSVRYLQELEVYDSVSGDILEPEITDPLKLATAIVRSLSAEEEDGTTLVHRMLDRAALLAIENGADGIVTGDDKLRDLKMQRALEAR